MYMVVFTSWSLCVIIGLINLGLTKSDPNSCVSKRTDTPNSIEKLHCLVTQDEVHLSCFPDELVVLTSLQIAVKNNSKDRCMKRVLTREDVFCCNVQDSDVFYDGFCLQDLWNKEDKAHFQDFMSIALRECSNSSQCVLEATMFDHLQTEIPGLQKHASYFQLLYSCIPVPKDSIKLCTPRVASGNVIHFQSGFTAVENTNKTCTCRISSQELVTVRAVDIRLTSGGLTFNSHRESKNISHGHLPIFGYREIFSAKKFNISARKGIEITNDSIWIQVSGSEDKDVNITCGETIPQVEHTTTESSRISPATQEIAKATRKTKRLVWGYWPLIYIATGSIFTIFLVVCVLGGLLLCRRKKTKTQRHHCGYPCLPSPPPVPPNDSRFVSRAFSDSRSEIRAFSPTSGPHSGASCGVSEIEAFLECKENSRGDISGTGTNSTNYDISHFFPRQTRPGQAARLESGFS